MEANGRDVSKPFVRSALYSSFLRGLPVRVVVNVDALPGAISVIVNVVYTREVAVLGWDVT